MIGEKGKKKDWEIARKWHLWIQRLLHVTTVLKA